MGPEPQLCTVLAGVAATEAEGFARLRSRRLAADSWLGRTILPGTERCTIEGDAWPRARYRCVGAPIGGDGRTGARLAFDALALELARCLVKPIWFPRDWRPGEPFEFAIGERLQAWTDRTTFPPSQVVLKLQQDAGRAYRVTLDLGGGALTCRARRIRPAWPRHMCLRGAHATDGTSRRVSDPRTTTS